jgi:hypothetical protein
MNVHNAKLLDYATVLLQNTSPSKANFFSLMFNSQENTKNIFNFVIFSYILIAIIVYTK